MRELVIPTTEEGSMEFKQWLADKYGFDVRNYHQAAYGYGVVKDDLVVGAAVLQPFFTPGNYLVSLSSEDPRLFFSKKLVIKALTVPFHPPFNAHKLTFIINTKYYRTIEVALRLGFRGEGILSHHFGEEDATILGLLRSQMMEA